MEKKDLELFLKKLKKMPDFGKVKFIFLFGSHVQDKENKFSDIDFAVYCEGTEKERFNFRLKLMSKLPEKFDIRIFQDLPLYVRINVLKGEVIYAKNEKFVYDKAYETIKKFEDFKKCYYDYLERRPVVG